ncbi:MAG: hypothetical protein NZ578_15245 [Candidatus Binatia bacterium]|nr:hypothetical protein [Candidatus Binatia bacterium]
MDKTLEKIESLNIALVCSSALLGWATGIVHAPSLVLGGAVMQVNFWLLKKIVRAMLAPGAGRTNRRKRVAVWLMAKGALLLLLLSALFVRYPVRAGSFAIGASLLLLACVIVSLPGLNRTSHA